MLYYAALGIMWCTLWAATALAMCRLPTDLRAYHVQRWPRWSVAGLLTRMTEHGRVVLPATALLLASIYVLSYSPTVHAVGTGGMPWMRGMMDFFVPVEWLIDESPLRSPLLAWADLWGQRATFAEARIARATEYWGTTPPWLYATGWAVVGIACVLVPAWIIRVIAIRALRARLPAACKTA